jgi:periplasmic mercuric ion binding protein
MRPLIPAAALILSAGGALAEEATTTIDVTGLTCPSCSYIVATTLKRIDTVEIMHFTEGSSEDGTYELRYDDAVTGPEEIISAVNGVGFGAALSPETGS